MDQEVEPLVHGEVIVIFDQDIVCDPVHAVPDRSVALGKLLVELLIRRLLLPAGLADDSGRKELQMGCFTATR